MNKKILLIEDEVNVVGFIKKGLTEEGFEVSVALDGNSGVNMAVKNNYDLMGNLNELQHMGDSNFTRVYYHTNNLLDAFEVDGQTYHYQYDVCGNQIQENEERHMQWDYADKLRLYYNQTSSGSEPSVYTHYLYDAGGNRVKKYTRTAGGNWETITYIDGLIEYRENDANEYQSISHVMDDSKRIATIRDGDTFGDTTPAIKYNLDDHLGSSNVLVDENGTLVNFEEYYPFGETSFGSYGKKRYRFCGKEKDEESGMYYYGARYYSPWLCRFISVDPKAGKYIFQTPYAYADNNPINKMDYNGEGTGEGEGGTNPTPASEASNPPVNIIVNAGEKPIEPKAPENNLDQLKDNFEKDKSFSNYEKYEQGKKDWENYNQQKAEYDKNLAEYNENKKFLEGVKNEILTSNDPVLNAQREELKGKTITIEVDSDITIGGKTLGAGTFTNKETGEVTIKFDRKLINSGVRTEVTDELNTVSGSRNIQSDITGMIVHELGHVIFNSQSPIRDREGSENAAQRWEAYYYRLKNGVWGGVKESMKHIDIRFNDYEKFRKGF